MKIIFLGTPFLALEVLKGLLEKHEVAAVLTQSDKPRGRSMTPVPSPVAELIGNKNIPLFKTEKIDEELITTLKELKADIFVTFAYGVILKKDFFSITRLGGINIHPSLLPEYRGPSPIQTAILDGKTRSGITIQTIKLKVDSGDILKQTPFDILPEDDAISIEEKASHLSKDLVLETLEDLANGRINPIVQDETKVTKCRMIQKTDGLIDWNEKADVILNKIRAFVKWPVGYSFIDGKKINIYKCRINNGINKEMFTNFQNGVIVVAEKNMGIIVKCVDSFLNIEQLQMQGKNTLDWKSFLNGYGNLSGKKFNDGVS